MPGPKIDENEDKEDDLDAEADDDDDLEGEDDEEPEEIPATAAGKASALRLLDLLVEKKALALHKPKPGAALIEAVARALEFPGSLKQRTTKLSDAIVDSEDVDELFVDDETLGELVKRW